MRSSPLRAGSSRDDAIAGTDRGHRAGRSTSDTRPLTGPQILTWIDDIVRGMGSKVPPASTATLKRIRAAARAALPADDRPLDFTDHETWLVRQAACDYLPSAISRYLAVDPAKRGRTGADRRSPDDVLLESLRAIEGYLDEAVVRANERDMAALLDYERFLKDRLARPSSLRIEPDERQAEPEERTRSRARVAALRDERLAAGDPRDRQEAPGRRGRDGLAGPRSLGDVGGRRDREAARLRAAVRRRGRAGGPGEGVREGRRRRGGRARPRVELDRLLGRRARAVPDRDRRAAVPDLERRLDLLRACWAASTTSRPASPGRSCRDSAAPAGRASRSSGTSTSTSPSSSRARSRSGRRPTRS